MTKEVLWYNGELGHYDLLDFEPEGLSLSEIEDNAWRTLMGKYGFSKEDKRKVMETLYLLDVSTLERVV